MPYRKFGWLVVVGALIAGLGCGPSEQAMEKTVEQAVEGVVERVVEQAMPRQASATLAGPEGSAITGSVTFTETSDGVTVVAHVEGAPPGSHGFHLHETGDCSAPDFTSAGGHFNPTDMPHGGPVDAERHAGDLGNLEIGEDGSGHLALTSDMLTVAAGPNSVVGRGVVFHEKTDDLVSQPTGAAGARLACGVVGEG